MFIYCFDKELEKMLERAGYKKASFSSGENYSVFLSNDKVEFNFEQFDSNKYKISNRLNF